MNVWLSLFLTMAAPTPADTLVVPIEEMVVTGTRSSESVLRAPAAISVVGRDAFANTRGISLKDGLGLVPGVFVQSRGGAQDVRVTIRGFGARGNGERSNAGNMRGIRIMTDGIPITEPDGRTSLDLVDIGSADRIEVARSNSSTLYGNASGGVVQLRTNLEFERPYLEVRERTGSFGYHREQGTIGFAAGRGRGTITVLNSTFDGWRDHSSSATTQALSRFSTPLDDRTRLGLLLDAVSNLNRFPGALTGAALDADPEQANPKFVQRDERRWNRVGRVAVSLDRELAAAQDVALTLFVEPKVLKRSERNRFRDFNRYHLGSSATYRLERALSGGVTSVTTAGGDEAFQDGSILFYDLRPDGSRGTNLVSNKREAANSAGAFVQEELRIGDRWSLRLAGRYDNLRYISEDFIDPSLTDEKTFTRFTPKGSVAYFFDRHTVYVALGGGVEAPAFNEIDPPAPFDTLTSFNPFLDAMHSTTYELGAKGDLVARGALGRLGYDLALYWVEVKNEIVPFNGGAFFFTAGKSRRKGAELGLDWRPLGSLDLRGALSLSDNEYVDYVNDLGDFGGRSVPGLPRALFEGSAEYRTGFGLTAGLTVESADQYFADDANTAATRPYTLLGASLGYDVTLGASQLRAYLAGDNLTDEDYVASVFINGVSGEYFEPGLPRSWSAGLTLRR
jgi:iron complex outermembrane receptor protein